jgi:hypothetical protein
MVIMLVYCYSVPRHLLRFFSNFRLTFERSRVDKLLWGVVVLGKFLDSAVSLEKFFDLDVFFET